MNSVLLDAVKAFVAWQNMNYYMESIAKQQTAEQVVYECAHCFTTFDVVPTLPNPFPFESKPLVYKEDGTNWINICPDCPEWERS